MRTSVPRALAGLVLAGSVLLPGGAPAARAATPGLVGWWTTTSVTSPAAATAPVGPDVPKGGMLVQSGSDSSTPVAFGALAFELPDGATVTRLVLRVAGSSGTVPSSSLGLCALAFPTFTPADGGAASDAPAYACTHEIVAAPSSDGTSYTFDAEPLRTGSQLAVAVVPASAAGRVVLAPPAGDALVLDERPTPAAGPATAPAEQVATDQQQPEPSGATVQAAEGSTTPPSLAPEAPGPLLAAATPPVSMALQPAPTTAAVAALAAHSSSSGGFHPLGLVALLLVGAVLASWSAAGSSAARSPTLGG